MNEDYDYAVSPIDAVPRKKIIMTLVMEERRYYFCPISRVGAKEDSSDSTKLDSTCHCHKRTPLLAERAGVTALVKGLLELHQFSMMEMYDLCTLETACPGACRL